MLKCAYCDMPCQQTREHIIPRWYDDTPGEAETFNACAPLTHLRGDIIVRDVCGTCNSGALSGLDSYGKELYQRYFSHPIYARETVSFDYDGDRLLRWLLKLSFNSARAQNADVRVLREYREVMLGKSPLPDHIRCWVHLVAATYCDPVAKVARQARREEQGEPNVLEPQWFRIGQFRLTSFPALFFVQRVVLINSFAFNLLIAPADYHWPCEDFEQWGRVFTDGYPDAKPITPGNGKTTITPGHDHTATSMYGALANYPTRFVEEQNSFVTQALQSRKDGGPMLILHVPLELIEEGDTAQITLALQDMVSTREKAMAFRQRVGVLVDGYDDDPRAIWQFPKARQFFRRLFVECPFVMLVAHPDGGLLKLLAACWVYEEVLTEEIEKQKITEFLTYAFRGLNALNHTLALSEEQNREICMLAAKVLFGEEPPVA